MNGRRFLWAVLLAGGTVISQGQTDVSASNVVDPARIGEPNYMSSYLAPMQAVTTATGPGLRVNLQTIWSGIWQERAVPMDWSGKDAFKFTIQNQHSTTLEFSFKVEGSAGNTDPERVDGMQFTVPGLSTRTFVVDLNGETAKSHGIRAMPPAITAPHIRLFMTKKANFSTVYKWSIYQRQSVNAWIVLTDVELLSTNRPAVGMVDTYGQFSRAQWSGKVNTNADLLTDLGDELADIADHPGTDGFKGAMSLPNMLSASTKWRTAKTSSGKWYLVHPNGKRFWSFGMTCINYSNPTSVTGREYMFQNMPPMQGAYADFYGMANGKETFDFVSANLYRKFGSSYKPEFVEHATSRLKSWGMNTAGAWSTPMEGQSQVPYTIVRNTQGFTKRLVTPMAYWSTLPDAFDAGFQPYLVTLMRNQLQGHNGKQNFMGIFVDNELSWGSVDTPEQRFQIGVAALNAAPSQPAKFEFIRQLTVKYRLIQKLNLAWGTNFASWQQLQAPNSFGNRSMNAKCQEDMRLFVMSFARAYYSKVKAALTTAGLTGLYLGSREAWPTPETTAAAMSYVDVYSVNMYRFASKVNWSFPESTKPVMIGEFSFGANDRGVFNPGSTPVLDQAARAEALKEYTRAALQSSKVVGINWFQYYDQPISGRAQDGESYAIGMVSVADNPYPEMVAAIRELGASIYTFRGN